MRRRMVFVTGPGCGLCGRAWRALTLARLVSSIDVVDVTRDTDALQWLERIPVVLAPGGIIVWEQTEGGSPLFPALRFALRGR